MKLANTTFFSNYSSVIIGPFKIVHRLFQCVEVCGDRWGGGSCVQSTPALTQNFIFMEFRILDTVFYVFP